MYSKQQKALSLASCFIGKKAVKPSPRMRLSLCFSLLFLCAPLLYIYCYDRHFTAVRDIREDLLRFINDNSSAEARRPKSGEQCDTLRSLSSMLIYWLLNSSLFLSLSASMPRECQTLLLIYSRSAVGFQRHRATGKAKWKVSTWKFHFSDEASAIHIDLRFASFFFSFGALE